MIVDIGAKLFIRASCSKLGETPCASALQAFGSRKHLINFINFLKNKIIKNTKNRSKENIAKHYDLGNDFFSLWLDKTLTYSSAIFEDPKQKLFAAQNNKYQKLIDLLKPTNGSKILTSIDLINWSKHGLVLKSLGCFLKRLAFFWTAVLC